MALEADSPTLETLPKAVAELLAHEARQLEHLARALEGIVGAADAEPVIDRGLAEYGKWRSRRILQSVGAIPLPDMLANWPEGDLYSVVKEGWGDVRATADGLQISVATSPDLTLLKERRREDLYLRQTRAFFEALASEIDGQLDADVRFDEARDAVVITLGNSGGCGDDAVISPYPKDEVTALNATVKNRAAQYYFLAREFIREFDASGEHAVRVGIQNFGKERGRALRERHEASGHPLNLQSMMSDFDYGGEGVWQFAEGSLGPTWWHQDCIYCPFAEVWRDLEGGLEIGYIYDMEFHVAEFMEYNPGARVKWEKLQTRGDNICGFRFTLHQE